MRFTFGRLTAESDVHPTVAAAGLKKFDFALLSTSWDARCMAVVGADEFRSQYGCLLKFANRGAGARRDIHDPVLTKFARSRIREVAVVEGPSEGIDLIWDQVVGLVEQAHKELGRPLRLFLDLATAPRYVTLGLLASSIVRGWASDVTIFYAEAAYPATAFTEHPGDVFTSGSWTSRGVPGVEGDWSPGYGRRYVVSAGVEGAKTYRLVSRADPDTVAVVLPQPSVSDALSRAVLRNNVSLLDDFDVSNARRVAAHGVDAVTAWKQLAEAGVGDAPDENVYYLLCGSKPHGVAMTLDALSKQSPAVLYPVPVSHREVATELSGRYWRYDVTDRLAL